MSVKASDHLKLALAAAKERHIPLFEAAMHGYYVVMHSNMGLKAILMESGSYKPSHEEEQEKALCLSLLKQIVSVIEDEILHRKLPSSTLPIEQEEKKREWYCTACNGYHEDVNFHEGFTYKWGS